jgi:hypothetical protein
MSGSYRQCSECGKRALSIATRCPGCGRELPSPEAPDHRSLDLGRFVTTPALLGLLAAGAVVASGLESWRRTRGPAEESSLLVGAHQSATSVEPSPDPSPEAVLKAGPEGPAPLASVPLAATLRRAGANLDSLPRTGGHAVTLPMARPGSSPASTPDIGRLLVARTWTHVRNRRSPQGGLEAVLMPGDTVEADSLRGGWYRVALDGEVMGYAYATTLIGTAPNRDH